MIRSTGLAIDEEFPQNVQEHLIAREQGHPRVWCCGRGWRIFTAGPFISEPQQGEPLEPSDQSLASMNFNGSWGSSKANPDVPRYSEKEDKQPFLVLFLGGGGWGRGVLLVTYLQRMPWLPYQRNLTCSLGPLCLVVQQPVRSLGFFKYFELVGRLSGQVSEFHPSISLFLCF